jgi:flagellar hook-associated protein 3 FlgL
VLNYGVYDPVGGLSALRPYTNGQAISLQTAGGVDFGSQVVVNGQPTAGDTFTINASSTQSLFQTMQNLIGVLRAPVGKSTYSTTEYANAIAGQLTNLDQAFDNVSRVQASVGTRMRELDSLGSASSDLDVQYQASLSKLQDLDYAKAISDFTMQNTNLQAAQKSFVQISGLSLFNYL